MIEIKTSDSWMRFGLESKPDELDRRERTLILGALSGQVRYTRNLAERNRDPEAKERNLVHLLELRVLMAKIEALP